MPSTVFILNFCNNICLHKVKQIELILCCCFDNDLSYKVHNAQLYDKHVQKDVPVAFEVLSSELAQQNTLNEGQAIMSVR